MRACLRASPLVMGVHGAAADLKIGIFATRFEVLAVDGKRRAQVRLRVKPAPCGARFIRLMGECGLGCLPYAAISVAFLASRNILTFRAMSATEAIMTKPPALPSEMFDPARALANELFMNWPAEDSI